MKDRIIELRRVKASQLAEHPKNWRTHPDGQRRALSTMLDRIGMAAALIARDKGDGTLELIDGHLRADIAQDEQVPVLVVDLDEAEADQMLASFDPLGAMAQADHQAIEELLQTLEQPLPIDMEALYENPTIGRPFSLRQSEIVELVRIALTIHKTPVSRLLRIAIKLIKTDNPGLKLIISYADTAQGHHGGIYQAAGWKYIGATDGDLGQRINGRVRHKKSVYSRWNTNRLDWLREHVDPKAENVTLPPKHKYVYILDRALQPTINAMEKPYPKRLKDSSEPPRGQRGEGGAAPTQALQ